MDSLQLASCNFDDEICKDAICNSAWIWLSVFSAFIACRLKTSLAESHGFSGYFTSSVGCLYISTAMFQGILRLHDLTFAHIPKLCSNETLSAMLHFLSFKTYGMMRCVASVADTEISKQSSVLISKNYEVIKMRAQCSFETSKSTDPATQLNIPQNQNLKR